MPIERPKIRTSVGVPFTASEVANAEALLSADVIALGLLCGAVLEVLGFARLRLAEGLVRDKNATAAITGDLGESPVTNNVTRLVVDVVVAEHHPVADRTVVIVLSPANRAGMPAA